MSAKPKKYSYRLSVGGAKTKKETCFEFPYGATKSVSARVSKSHMEICFESTKLFDVEDKYGYWRNLLREGYKRAELVHLLLYGVMLSKANKVLTICDPKGMQIVSKDLTYDFILFGMANGAILRTIPAQVKQKEVIERVFGVPKKDFDNKNASLNAYIYSKYQAMETERFMYLWMAFNGAYGVVGKPSRNERENINKILGVFDNGGEMFSSKKRDEHGRKLLSLFAGMQSISICEDITNPASYPYQRIKKFIDTYYDSGNKISPRGVVLGDVAYYLRCNYFHANSPFLLMTYADDVEFEALSCVNAVLERFLDENLHKILTEY